MHLSSKEMAELRKIIQIAQGLIDKAGRSGKGKVSARKAAAAPSSRRSGKELTAFRDKLMAKRKAGLPVAQIV